MRRPLAVCLVVGLLAGAGFAQSPPSLSVQVSNGSVRLRITGEVGSTCTIQWVSSLNATNNWQLLTNLAPLASSPFLVVDTSAFSARRFYRAFAQRGVIGLVWISPGTFVMGSPTSEAERYSDETQHTVTLTQGFYMGQHAVTQGEYLALMGSNPSYFTTLDYNGNPITRT